jgi:hypothetical protein
LKCPRLAGFQVSTEDFESTKFPVVSTDFNRFPHNRLSSNSLEVVEFWAQMLKLLDSGSGPGKKELGGLPASFAGAGGGGLSAGHEAARNLMGPDA